VQNDKLFPNGLYTIIDDNASNKQWLYFVFPLIKKCENKEIIFADHFTFCIDKTDKNNPCHFHSTFYYCTMNLKILNYVYQHIKDYFPDELDIPKKGNVDNIIVKETHTGYKPVLLDLIRKPWNQNKPLYVDDGGGKNKTRKYNIKPKARPIISVDFSYIWKEHEFKSMQAFGLKNVATNKIQWSVSLFRKERERVNQVYTAYNFETDIKKNSNEIELDFQNTLAELMKRYE